MLNKSVAVSVKDAVFVAEVPKVFSRRKLQLKVERKALLVCFDPDRRGDMACEENTAPLEGAETDSVQEVLCFL